MKKLFLTFSLLFLGLTLSAHAQSALSIALQQENSCLVQRFYEKAPIGEPLQKTREYAVDKCISFSRGVGAWYYKDKISKDKDFDIDSEAARATLVRFKMAAIGFLERQVGPACQQRNLDLPQCLDKLGLPA
ncbi:hypothetical protein LC612_32490 [Nostoc sp. CHAB 5834]|nr:hypothetical protein [Nostoc sp. CHAB 5834]